MKLQGPTQPDPVDPLTGFYSAAGGRWVYLHCNFLNHRDAALVVLGIGRATKLHRVFFASRPGDDRGS